MADNKSMRPGSLTKVVSARKTVSEKKRNEPYRDVLEDLAESSSIHGIPKIVSTPQLAIKMLWILLFIATVTIYIIQLITLFTTFYDYPVQTTVKLRFSTLPFPAITICNINAVKHSKINTSDELKTFVFNTSTSFRKKRQAEWSKPRDSDTAYSAYVQKRLLFGNGNDDDKHLTRENGHGDRRKRSTSDNTTPDQTDSFGDAHWDDCETQYSKILSSRHWPDNGYLDLNYQSITEEPLYEPIRFVSDIGGTTGLFVGASVLSLVEVLQLVLETVLFLRRKCRDRASNSKVEDRHR